VGVSFSCPLTLENSSPWLEETLWCWYLCVEYLVNGWLRCRFLRNVVDISVLMSIGVGAIYSQMFPNFSLFFHKQHTTSICKYSQSLTSISQYNSKCKANHTNISLWLAACVKLNTVLYLTRQQEIQGYLTQVSMNCDPRIPKVLCIRHWHTLIQAHTPGLRPPYLSKNIPQ